MLGEQALLGARAERPVVRVAVGEQRSEPGPDRGMAGGGEGEGGEEGELAFLLLPDPREAPLWVRGAFGGTDDDPPFTFMAGGVANMRALRMALLSLGGSR